MANLLVPATPIPTINSPAHQDDFHVLVRQANEVLRDVEEQGSDTVPVVRLQPFPARVVSSKAHCRPCDDLLRCCGMEPSRTPWLYQYIPCAQIEAVCTVARRCYLELTGIGLEHDVERPSVKLF